jgi:hypothetical protein
MTKSTLHEVFFRSVKVLNCIAIEIIKIAKVALTKLLEQSMELIVELKHLLNIQRLI